jgi:uncharacterized protein YhfF
MFKDEMAELIEKDQKTATRRLSTKKFYRVGSIQPVQRNYFSKARTYIKILKQYRQKLRDMTTDDARAEGFQSVDDYLEYLVKINAETFEKMGIETMQNPLTHDYIYTDALLNVEPTVYEFERIKADRIIIDTDDWPVGFLIGKDGKTWFKIIEKRNHRRRSFKYWLQLESVDKEAIKNE